jgi:hypothetical protein
MAEKRKGPPIKRARLKEAHASCNLLSAHRFFTWIASSGGGDQANGLFLQPFLRRQPARSCLARPLASTSRP